MVEPVLSRPIMKIYLLILLLGMIAAFAHMSAVRERAAERKPLG
jgi:hypothetical protein